MLDPQRVDDAKRALGVGLARWRNASGLTQLALARRVPAARSTIAGTESGRQCPDRIFWQRCELALAAGGELLAGYDDYQRIKQQLDQEKAEAAQRARWGEVEGDSQSAQDGVLTVTGQASLPGIQVVRLPASSSSLVEAAWLADRSTGPGWPGLGRASVGVDPALALHWSEMLRLLAASHNIFGSRQVYDAAGAEKSNPRWSGGMLVLM